jgi:SPP1 family predicted phage head-tail adaptor
LANSYTELGPRSIQIKWLSGNELEQAKQVFANATVQVVMRKPREFTLIARDQMRIDGTTYGIGAVLPSDEMFHDIKLLCEVQQ